MDKSKEPNQHTPDAIQLSLFDDLGNPQFSVDNDPIAPVPEKRPTQPKQASKFDEGLRKRSHRKKLKVTLPDGTIICGTTATDTYLETLRTVEPDRLATVGLEIGHQNIFSRELYPKYDGWMKPLRDGWYVNMQSDTQQKYLQLKIINNKLQLGLKVEMADDFVESKRQPRAKFKRNVGGLSVIFPDGMVIKDSDSQSTFIKAARRVGLDLIQRKGIQYQGKPLVASTRLSNHHISVADKWLLVPNNTKDKAKCLISMSAIMRLGLKVAVEKKA